MPLTRQRLLAITDTCTFTYLGERVTVEYYVQRVLGVSDEHLDALRREVEALPPGDLGVVYAFMVRTWTRFFAAWDVTEVEGGPVVPLTDGAALYEMDPGLQLWLSALIACRDAAVQGKGPGTTPPGATGGSSSPAGSATLSPSPTSAPEPTVGAPASSRSTRLPSPTSRSKRGLRPTG